MFQKVTGSKNFKKAAVILMLFAFLAQPLIMPAVAWAEVTNIVDGGSKKGSLQSYDSQLKAPASFATMDGAVALGVGTYATKKYSFSMGNYVNASGQTSFAMGKYVNAVGSYSVGFGNNVTAMGTYSFAAGNMNTAKGSASFAMGQGTYACGSYSVAMGKTTYAMSDSSVAMGRNTNASGNASFAMGDGTWAAGGASFSMGYGTVSNGSYSAAIGYKTYSKGHYSVAMGMSNNASQHGAITGGGAAISDKGVTSNPNTASGYNAVAFGEGSTASGDDSFVMGKNAKAMGKYSVAMGQNATAAVDNSFAFGGNAGGANAVALGFGSSVTGANSVALGSTSVAKTDNEVSVGYYNSSTDYRYRKITNVAAGDLSETSAEAVVGSQLYAEQKARETAVSEETTARTDADAAADVTQGTVTDSSLALKNAAGTAVATVDMSGLVTNQGTGNAGNISTLQGYFTDGIANKATADAYGNDINSTYATKTALSDATVMSTAGKYYTAGDSVTAALGKVDTQVRNNYDTIQGTYNNATYADNKLTLTKVDGSTTELTISGSGGGVSEDLVKGYSTLTVNGVSVNKSTGLELVGGTNVCISADADTGKITFNATGGGSGSVDFAAAKGFATNATPSVSGDYALGVGYNSTASHTGSVALGYASCTTGDYEVSVGNATQTRKITNVTAGDLSATSTDAVVGSQLNATNVKVATNAADIATNKNAITTINGSAVMTSGITAEKVATYDGYSTYITNNGLNANSKAITNVAAGTADTDAATVKQSSIYVGTTKINNENGTKFVAGDGITFDTTTAGQLKITSTGSGGVTEDVVKGYSTIKVGGTSMNSSTGLELVGGTNVCISTDAAAGKITFDVTGGGSGSVDFAAAKGFATNATPSVSGDYALGVGYNATASHTGSVALGYASCTTGDYEVSVGSDSQTRKITNVTTGTNDTDAATVKQTQLWVEEAGTGVRKNINNADGVKLTSSDSSITFDVTEAGTLDIKTAGGSGGTDSNAVHYDIESAQRQNSITLKDTEDGTTAQVAIKNVASAGELSSTNTNASTGADVYNATTVTTASVQSSRYAANSKVTDAVKALDTAIGDMSGFASQNYAKNTTNVAANITALDTQVKANADAIDTINDSAVMKSGINSDKVAKYEKYVTATGLNGNGSQITNVASAGTLTGTNTNASTGADIYNEVRPTENGAYVKTAETTGANLTALDKAIGAKITEDGEYIKKSDTNSVNANIQALDTAIKETVAAGYKYSDGTATGTGTVALGKTVTIKGKTGKNITTTFNGADGNASFDIALNDDITLNSVTAKALNSSTVKADTSVKVGSDTTITSGSIVLGSAVNLTATSGLKVADNYTFNTNGLQVGSGTSLTNTALKIGGKSYITTAGINASTQAISNVGEQTAAAGGTYAATTGQVYNAGLKEVSLGTDKKTLTVAEYGVTKTVDLSALETTQSKDNATKIKDLTDKVGTVADGKYVCASKTIGENINALDTRVATNTDAIAANADAIGKISNGSTDMKAQSYSVGKDTYITSAGINASGKEISNVKAAELAEKGTYAATTGQLYTEQTKREAADIIKVNGGDNVNSGNGVNFVSGSNINLSADDKGNITISATGLAEDIADYDVDGKTLIFKDSDGKTDTGKILLKNVEIDGLGTAGKKVSEGDKEAKAEGAGAIASGYNSCASGAQSVASGYGATAEGAQSIAIGNGAWTDPDAKNSIATGNGAQTYAVNSIATGNGAIADEANAVAVGNGAYAGGKSAIATGNGATASGDASVATGNGATASAGNSIAIGNGANVSNMGTSSIAVGESSTVSGTQSIAIGVGNVVSGNNSGAFGDPNIVTGTGSYAIGNNNTITGNNTFVMGNNVTAVYDNSVVLGDKSTLEQAHNVTTERGTDNTGAVAGKTGVVSVGSYGNERQIQHVAAGELSPSSTDAVNGAQLYEVSKEGREIAAMSAALAGLHYLEPTGEGTDKITGAVAYGGYRGENAAAVGIAYKPNPDLMFSAATSIGNHQQSYNAGMSFKFGKGRTITRAEVAKQIKFVCEENKQLKASNEALNCEVIGLRSNVEKQSTENAELKATVKMLLERMEQLEKKVK